jgi:hypothetical protein
MWPFLVYHSGSMLMSAFNHAIWLLSDDEGDAPPS